MITIRKEAAKDFDAIRRVNEKAFGRSNEADLVDKLRNNGALSVSLVAEDHGEIVGHIAFSSAELEGDDSGIQIAGLGPVAVLPDRQRQGIGSNLVRSGLAECRRLGFAAVILVGHEDYYPRFGFVPARPRGFTCGGFEVPENVWMMIELDKDALKGKSGTIFFRPEFKECA